MARLAPIPHEEVETPKRQRLTKYEFAVLFLEQRGLCGCGCGEKLERGKVDEEHSNALCAGGTNPKPDSLWRRDCHKEKTKTDRKRKKKIDHLTGKTGRHKPGAKVHKIAKRGFDARYRRKMNGKTEKRK